MQKQQIIALVGPTSSGKSALAVWLAKKIDCEVISADSRQVYRGLNIGTGKITKKEMSGIPHHLLDVANPKNRFSVDDFVRLGQKACSHILENKRIPIVVGGTGLYVDALLGRVSFPHIPPNPALRAKLEKKSAAQLFEILQKLDPERAKTIEAKNSRRLIRAIEIAYSVNSSRSPSMTRRSRPAFTPPAAGYAPEALSILWLGINPPAEVLAKKIKLRLKARIKAGMIGEAKRLHTKGLSYKRMDELGLEYRYLSQLLQHKITRQVFETELERSINGYTKRQWRWFKRNQDIHWVGSNAEALKLAQDFLL